jgi:hypothetical protein
METDSETPEPEQTGEALYEQRSVLADYAFQHWRQSDHD